VNQDHKCVDTGMISVANAARPEYLLNMEVRKKEVRKVSQISDQNSQVVSDIL
jgi:hypothetical protein